MQQSVEIFYGELTAHPLYANKKLGQCGTLIHNSLMTILGFFETSLLAELTEVTAGGSRTITLAVSGPKSQQPWRWRLCRLMRSELFQQPWR